MSLIFPSLMSGENLAIVNTLLACSGLSDFSVMSTSLSKDAKIAFSLSVAAEQVPEASGFRQSVSNIDPELSIKKIKLAPVTLSSLLQLLRLLLAANFAVLQFVKIRDKKKAHSSRRGFIRTPNSKYQQQHGLSNSSLS